MSNPNKQTPNPDNQPSNNGYGSLSDLPTFDEYRSEQQRYKKAFNEAKRNGTLPEGIRDEYDYREYREELEAKLEEYNSLVEKEYQLRPVEPESSIYPSSIDPSEYIEIYAKIDERTPLKEAQNKLAKIRKAADIRGMIQETADKTYTEKERQQYCTEIVEYLRKNNDQYDYLRGECNGQTWFRDGRLTPGPHLGGVDAAELFWNLQNDTMSKEAWVYFCQNGNSYIADDGRFRLQPEMEQYIKELLEEQRQIAEQEKQKRRSENPDIFLNPDMEFIMSNTRLFTNKVLDDMRQNTLSFSYENLKEFNNEIIQYLSKILELDEPPQIQYKNVAKDSIERGSYNHYQNEIEFCYEEGRDDIVTEEDIDTIAHEMWHAHQHSVADSNQENALNAELYKKNFDDYVKAEEDYDGYRSQLVEDEARTFAFFFTAIIKEDIKSKKAKQEGPIRRFLSRVFGSNKE